MNTILLVDDHTILRQGVIRILEGMHGYRFRVDEAPDGQEALALAQKNRYDLVLLDISLPGRNGLEILKQLKRVAPKVPVLILSMWPAEQYGARAMRAGASGYLTKESAPRELQTAVGKILGGGRYVTETVADILADAVAESKHPDAPLNELLSDREFQTLCMMASGKTLTEIADELCLSVKTISTYRARLLEKLKLRTTGEMIAYAVSAGLAPR